MSDSSFLVAESFVAMRAASTRQALQTEMVKQQADAEHAMAELLQESAEQQKAALPTGQGQNVDITA
ncbi:putative motility protein [Bosea sp. (in: a-proteobacteria)]|uniref:putative motility protein n=1 Tax=Bosea sp. (in: a-proteobacteria) TaxID=1871050 RepID=UPI002FC6A484